MIWVSKVYHREYVLWTEELNNNPEPNIQVVSDFKKSSYILDSTKVKIEKSNNDEALTEIFAEITASFITKPSPLFAQFNGLVAAQIGGRAVI